MATPLLVAQMGDYKKGDTGIGSGDHYDLRLARSKGKARGDINPYLNRFVVDGKPLSSYKQTSVFGEKRGSKRHEGVDFGINTSFGGKASARNLYVDPKYPVSNVRAFYDANGGGWVTQVTFADGVSVNILHQNQDGANHVASQFKPTQSTQSQQMAYNEVPQVETPQAPQVQATNTDELYATPEVQSVPSTSQNVLTGTGVHDILGTSPAQTAVQQANDSLNGSSLFGNQPLFGGMSSLFDMVDVNG